MQKVSELYDELYISGKYFMETNLVIGETGSLITENNERILFGGDSISVAGGAGSGFGENTLISVKTTRRVFKDNVPEIGCCPSGEIYVEMLMPPGEVERKAVIKPYIRLVSEEDHTIHSEWVAKGVFYTDTRENSHNDDDLDILTIHGYDALMKANQEYGEYYSKVDFSLSDGSKEGTGISAWTFENSTYTASVINSKIVVTSGSPNASIIWNDDSKTFGSTVTITWSSGRATLTTTTEPPATVYGQLVFYSGNTLAFPAKAIDVVRDIASKIGADIDTHEPSSVYLYISNDADRRAHGMPTYSNTRYENPQFEVQYPSQYTMRETLGYIGAMYGGNFVINDLGELQFIPLYSLPPETSLLIDEIGYYITFGGDRISLVDID